MMLTMRCNQNTMKNEYMKALHDNHPEGGYVINEVSYSSFDLPDTEKKKVPLTYGDLLERIKSGKTMWFVNDRDTVFNIIDFDYKFVYVINGDTRGVVDYTMEELMGRSYMFADGDLCWKEVEEGGAE